MKFLSLIVLSFIVAMAAHAQGKTAYVSTEEIFATIPQVKKADTVIAQYGNQLSIQYDESQQKINDLSESFIKDSLTYTTEVKEAKRKVILDKINELQKTKVQYEKDIEAFKEKTYAPIREKVLTAIANAAKEKGYTTVLYREQAIFFPPKDDLTPIVKKKLGAK
jgi:outer membrane protein